MDVPKTNPQNHDNSRAGAKQETSKTSARTKVKWVVFTVFAIAATWYGPALTRPEFWFERVAGNGTVPKELSQKKLKEVRGNLEKHVKELAFNIGPRSYLAPKKLEQAASYIKIELDKRKANNSVRSLPYKLGDLPKKHRYRCTKPRCLSEAKDYDEVSRTLGTIEFKNIEFEIRGCKQPDEIIVIGAHYDSDACESSGCNLGADDNATGVAALIELAGILSKDKLPAKTLRFVAFANEEEPFFQTEAMGSYVYALETRRSNERVKGMLSLETMGYFRDEPGTQTPEWISLLGFPTKGNFITFVGDWDSANLTRKAVKAFQGIPVEGLITYRKVPGVGWSDHWAYWQHGVPAIMVTDTALARNLCYHKNCDITQRLDYDKLARVVMGLADVIKTLDRKL